MIDLDALVSLRAVAAHGSVVAAAEALGFTPSAVSQQVKRLERQLGVPLLERVGRGVVLTDPGRHLADDGARVLAEVESLETGLRRVDRSPSGRLRLSAFSTAVRGLVAPALGMLRETHPDLHVALREEEPWRTVGLVAAGHTDLGVVHSWGDVPLDVPDNLVATALGTDEADVIMPTGHPLAGRRRVTPRDLRDQAWVATPQGTICRQWLHRMYVGVGRSPQIAHVSLEYDSHIALVAAGLGIALVPRLGRATLPDGLVAVPAAEPVPTRTLVAVHRSSMHGSPAVETVVRTLLEVGTGTGNDAIQCCN